MPPSWTIYADFVMKFAATFRNLIIWLATSGFLNVLNHENLSLGTLAVLGKLEKIRHVFMRWKNLITFRKAEIQKTVRASTTYRINELPSKNYMKSHETIHLKYLEAFFSSKTSFRVFFGLFTCLWDMSYYIIRLSIPMIKLHQQINVFFVLKSYFTEERLFKNFNMTSVLIA
jgi:hypothetical protein